MCLRFACFGLHKHDDDDIAPPTTTPPPQRNGYHNGHANYGNGAHRASPHQTAAEAGRKASNDVRRGPAAVPKGVPEMLKPQQPAWNSKVAEAAGHGGQAQYYYYQPAHKEGYHYYTAAAASTDHERY